MFSKIFIFIVLTVINSVFTLKSNSLCYLSENDQVCQGRLNFKCTSNICTQSEEICEKYEHIKDMLGSSMRVFIPNAYVQKYDEFEEHIKECNYYAVKPVDICINKDNCFHKKTLPMRGNFMKVFEKKLCDCTGKLKYKCGVNYCAVNKIACEEFLQSEISELTMCEDK